MVATTGDPCASDGCIGLSAYGASVDDLPASNGEVNWQRLEALGRKGQRVVPEHDEVGQLPCCDAAERLLLKARVGGVDSLAAQGLLPRERLVSIHLLAAE